MIVSGGEHISGNLEAGEVVETVHFDNSEEKFVRQRVQDIEPVLDHVKDMRDIKGNQVGSEFKHAASVPLVVVEAWLNVKGLQMSDFKGAVVNDFLNDPNNSAFRIWPGRV